LKARPTVQLWDPLLRLCHLSLATVFFADYFFNEEGDDWHQWLGYYGLVCVLLRLVWGFVGPMSLHRFLADAVLALVCLHVLAAIVESLRLGENLPLSMITGRRRQR
jgi:cytochrome b